MINRTSVKFILGERILIEVECPFCGRVIACHIDELKGGFESFEESIKFMDSVQTHLQKHTSEELTIWVRHRLLEQVKAKLGLAHEPYPLTIDEQRQFAEIGLRKGLTEVQLHAEAIREYIKAHKKEK